MNNLRINYSSGAPLEDKTGYSRMVKLGNQVYIGGTTSVQPDGSVYGTTQYEQAKYIFEKMLGLLEQTGSCKEDVYKVQFYTTDITKGAEVAKAYSEIFHDVRPLFTGVGISALNRPTQLVEIELEAMIGARAK